MSKTNGNTIGNLTFKDGILTGSEIVFDYDIEFVNDSSLSEADIDSKTAKILEKLGWKSLTEFRQQKTNILEIDDYIRSKSVGAKGKGKVDFYLLIDNKLKILVDNKKPKESVLDGLEDAKYYADCLLVKNYDIRITMSYNGKDCLLRVYDSKKKEWKALLIDGKELKAFPSKELVDIIYRYKDLEAIKFSQESQSINISSIIKQLRERYRKIPFIQNDNQKTIDFTIAFIALRLILEKHGSQIGKSWDDFRLSEQKKLKETIKTSVNDIIDSKLNGYEEVFKIKQDNKGKIKAFDFLDVIDEFPNNTGSEKGELVKIFEIVDQLPSLHSSKFDVFSEIYQSLMDKHTKKIFGQFFTPRHLIKTLIRLFYDDEIPKIVEDYKGGNPKTICDPASGTGGFLTESFKHIATNVSEINTIDLAKNSIFGFDIYPANAVRSRINMYLAGDGFSKITSFDSLKYNERKFDYILTNPPFGKGDYAVNADVISNKRLEINFLIKVVELLNTEGKALIIIPDGVLEATTLSPIRNWLVKNCLIEKIISLPKHEFAPYTHEKTNVLFLKKRPHIIENLDDIKTERIWMYIIDCDGYTNSDKRFRTDKVDKNNKWLHDELSLWRDTKGAFHISLLEERWKKKIQDKADEKFTNEWGEIIEGKKYGYVDMTNILQEEYTSYGEFKSKDVLKLIRETNQTPTKISDLFEIVKNETEEDDEKTLISDYENILNEKNIVYDSYDEVFYDKNKPIIKKLINLSPEKYLRKPKIETVTLENFKKQNKDIYSKIKEELVDVDD
jgi:type I restriction-modification system DNA methylase subunit